MDPFQFLKNSPPGIVVFGFTTDPELSIDFLVRETSDRIEILPKRPELEMRGGMLDIGGVLMVVVMFRILGVNRICETFWDFYRQPDVREGEHLFDHMATESAVTFHFVGESGEPEAVIRVPHPLRSFFLQAAAAARRREPWDREAFEEAKVELLSAYPSTERMWERLGSSVSSLEI